MLTDKNKPVKEWKQVNSGGRKEDREGAGVPCKGGGRGVKEEGDSSEPSGAPIPCRLDQQRGD